MGVYTEIVEKVAGRAFASTAKDGLEEAAAKALEVEIKQAAEAAGKKFAEGVGKDLPEAELKFGIAKVAREAVAEIVERQRSLVRAAGGSDAFVTGAPARLQPAPRPVVYAPPPPVVDASPAPKVAPEAPASLSSAERLLKIEINSTTEAAIARTREFTEARTQMSNETLPPNYAELKISADTLRRPLPATKEALFPEQFQRIAQLENLAKAEGIHPDIAQAYNREIRYISNEVEEGLRTFTYINNNRPKLDALEGAVVAPTAPTAPAAPVTAAPTAPVAALPLSRVEQRQVTDCLQEAVSRNASATEHLAAVTSAKAGTVPANYEALSKAAERYATDAKFAATFKASSHPEIAAHEAAAAAKGVHPDVKLAHEQAADAIEADLRAQVDAMQAVNANRATLDAAHTAQTAGAPAPVVTSAPAPAATVNTTGAIKRIEAGFANVPIELQGKLQHVYSPADCDRLLNESYRAYVRDKDLLARSISPESLKEQAKAIVFGDKVQMKKDAYHFFRNNQVDEGIGSTARRWFFQKLGKQPNLADDVVFTINDRIATVANDLRTEYVLHSRVARADMANDMAYTLALKENLVKGSEVIDISNPIAVRNHAISIQDNGIGARIEGITTLDLKYHNGNIDSVTDDVFSLESSAGREINVYAQSKDSIQKELGQHLGQKMKAEIAKRIPSPLYSAALITHPPVTLLTGAFNPFNGNGVAMRITKFVAAVSLWAGAAAVKEGAETYEAQKQPGINPEKAFDPNDVLDNFIPFAGEGTSFKSSTGPAIITNTVETARYLAGKVYTPNPEVPTAPGAAPAATDWKSLLSGEAEAPAPVQTETTNSSTETGTTDWKALLEKREDAPARGR